MGEFDFKVLMPWLIVAGILLTGWLAIKIINRVMEKTLKKTSLDPTLHRFICSGTNAVCWIVLIGIALPYIGVSLSTFITMIGVAGAAIALALKDSLSNISGGIIIIISKPFKKDDSIQIDAIVGKVEQIDLLYTTLTTADGKMVYIPNGKLSTSTIINSSKGEQQSTS